MELQYFLRGHLMHIDAAEVGDDVRLDIVPDGFYTGCLAPLCVPFQVIIGKRLKGEAIDDFITFQRFEKIIFPINSITAFCKAAFRLILPFSELIDITAFYIPFLLSSLYTGISIPP